MNFLEALTQRLNTTDKHIATLQGKKGQAWVANTLEGKTVLLQGDGNINDMVYYDRVSGNIIGKAPQVEFSVWEV